MDQLYTLSRVLKGVWEFAQPVHICLVDPESLDSIPWGILWGVLWDYGVSRPLMQAVHSLYDMLKISTSKSEAMVLSWKKVERLLQVGEEILPQGEEFLDLGVLFTSQGKIEGEIERRIRLASAVRQTLRRFVGVRRELSRKV